MAERALLLLTLTVVFIGLVGASRAWARRRVAGLREASPSWTALGERPDGRLGLVVFSTPACVACRTAQEPAVQAIGMQFGGALRVVRVDIGDRPSVARAFRILTAPSTVVLDSGGQITAVNQGFASSDVLRAQISAAGAGQGLLPSLEPPAQPARVVRASAGRR